MLQFVLEFLQAILGKGEKEPDAFISVLLRIANLVRFDGSEIVLLRRCRRAQERHRDEDEGTQEKTCFEFHRRFSVGGVPGFSVGGVPGFSVGGAVSRFSKGRRGKSIFNSPSSMPIRSWRTICSGGL